VLVEPLLIADIEKIQQKLSNESQQLLQTYNAKKYPYVKVYGPQPLPVEAKRKSMDPEPTTKKDRPTKNPTPGKSIHAQSMNSTKSSVEIMTAKLKNIFNSESNSPIKKSTVLNLNGIKPLSLFKKKRLSASPFEKAKYVKNGSAEKKTKNTSDIAKNDKYAPTFINSHSVTRIEPEISSTEEKKGTFARIPESIQKKTKENVDMASYKLFSKFS